MSDFPAKSKQLAYWQTLIAAAKLNPGLLKAMQNDIELQWRMLVDSGQARGVQRDEFIRWSVRRRSASGSYKEQILEHEDLQLRHKFIQAMYGRRQKNNAGLSVRLKNPKKYLSRSDYRPRFKPSKKN